MVDAVYVYFHQNCMPGKSLSQTMTLDIALPVPDPAALDSAPA